MRARLQGPMAAFSQLCVADRGGCSTGGDSGHGTAPRRTALIARRLRARRQYVSGAGGAAAAGAIKAAEGAATATSRAGGGGGSSAAGVGGSRSISGRGGETGGGGGGRGGAVRGAALLLARIAANGHTICDDELRPRGVGLYPLGAMVNHGEPANAAQSFQGAAIGFRWGCLGGVVERGARWGSLCHT
jgi:hypothetical protein